MNETILSLIVLIIKDIGLPFFTEFLGKNGKLPTEEEIIAAFQKNVDDKIKQGEDFLGRTK